MLADVAHDAHGYRLVRALIDAEDAINAEGTLDPDRGMVIYDEVIITAVAAASAVRAYFAAPAPRRFRMRRRER